MERRTFLAALGATAATGCSRRQRKPQRQERLYRISETETLDENDYDNYFLDFEGVPANEAVSVAYSIKVLDGPRIEAAVMPYEEFEHFTEIMDPWEVEYVDGMHRTDVDRKQSADAIVEPGEYIYVVDNSHRGLTDPPSDFQNNEAVYHTELSAWRYA